MSTAPRGEIIHTAATFRAVRLAKDPKEVRRIRYLGPDLLFFKGREYAVMDESFRFGPGTGVYRPLK